MSPEQARVRVIGIGCHPGQLTAEARSAIESCDYVIAADKGGTTRCSRCAARSARRSASSWSPSPILPGTARRSLDEAGYDGAVVDWHDARAAAYASVIASRPGAVGFLVWGDPAFYDSTIRVVDRLSVRMGLEYDVLPGISALSLLAARHRVVLHEVGRPVLVTTGRRLAAEVEAGHDNLVVMLDGRLQAASLAGVGHLVGRQPRQPPRGAGRRPAGRRPRRGRGRAGASQGGRRLGDGHLPPAARSHRWLRRARSARHETPQRGAGVS